jgi:predicted esterase
VLVGFHGYAEHAAHMMEALAAMRGDRPWLLVSVQALNRFYNRARDVVGNWMTREDRELAIADNIAYVAAVVAAVRDEHPTTDVIVYAGFSQGVAMAYRAAAAGARSTEVGQRLPRASGLILLAGDIPPDVAPSVGSLPPLLIGRGTADHWYTEPKAGADLDVCQAAGVTPAVHVFEGGHEWHPSFISRAGHFLDGITPSRPGASRGRAPGRRRGRSLNARG